MRHLRLILLFICLLALNFACEKDDICVDGDTPLLIIRFYDIQDTTQSKSVSDLRVIGLGKEGPVNTFADRSTIDSLGLPLRLDGGITEFAFILDSAGSEGEETGNIDTLRFNYTVEPIFVSRACGFTGSFENLDHNLTTDTDNWIQGISVRQANVVKQDSTHVAIYH